MSLDRAKQAARRLLLTGARTDERDALLDAGERVSFTVKRRIAHRLERANLAPVEESPGPMMRSGRSAAIASTLGVRKVPTFGRRVAAGG